MQAATKQSAITEDVLSNVRDALASSLKEFTLSSSRAIKRLYAGPRREKGVWSDSDSGSDNGQATLPTRNTAEGPNEAVFHVYL